MSEKKWEVSGGIAARLSRCAIAWGLAVALGGVPASSGPAHAFGDGTPDTDPPAEEVACDGLSGREWGLCVAYCEAQDCPGSDHPSCEVLREKLFGLFGTDQFPCDGSGGGGGGIG
jgi:hypothetical protein